MKKADIVSLLWRVRKAKADWALAQTRFNSDVEAVMTRLLHEAAVNRMSPEEVAQASGFTVKRIRAIMRIIGLNPRDGKHLLSAKAAEALANNAELLGIEPSEMDLMSPLAYLPMGEQMKRALQDKAVSKVTELDGYDEAKARIAKALSIGVEADEILMTTEEVEHTAGWLASEGIK